MVAASSCLRMCLTTLKRTAEPAKCLRKTLNYVHAIRCRFPDVHFEVILGVDANVGFPARFNEILGDAVLPLRSSYTPPKIRVVSSWIEGLGLSAANTFCRQSIETATHDGLWTRMAKNRRTSKSQIDYLTVSGGISGYAWAHSMPTKTFRKSDHRLVVGRFQMEQIVSMRITDGQSGKG